MDDVAADLFDAVERHGVLLVHDKLLPSVTALVAGGPVAGSWWSHPLANTMYNSIAAIARQVAIVKLLNGKNTLVARRLWPELAAVGLDRDGALTRGLDADAHALLADVLRSDDPLVIESARRRTGGQLERRLLVYALDIHTDRGHHVKGYVNWSRWSAHRKVEPAADSAAARRAFEAIVGDLPARARLPW